MNVYREIFADFKQGELAQFYRLMYPELMVYANRLLGADFAFLAEDCVQNAVYKCYLRDGERDAVEKLYFLQLVEPSLFVGIDGEA